MTEQKKICIRFMKHIREKHEIVYNLLDGLSHEERGKICGSYYKNLYGLFSHSLGGFMFFKSLFEGALEGGSKAKSALAALNDLKFKDKDFMLEDWKQLKTASEKIGSAFTEFAEMLTDAELAAKAKAPFSDKPLPIPFLFEALLVHSVHHLGQISQVLDEMKIDNNFSGINPVLAG